MKKNEEKNWFVEVYEGYMANWTEGPYTEDEARRRFAANHYAECWLICGKDVVDYHH